MVIGALETKYDDLIKETPPNLSGNKYLKSAEQAKEFCKNFTDLLENFKKSIKNSADDDF